VNLTTRQLQAFLLVAKFKSFARASERVFMTPSGLSILMRELETQLGFQLFDRNRKQVALTEYGQALLPVVQQGGNRRSGGSLQPPFDLNLLAIAIALYDCGTVARCRVALAESVGCQHGTQSLARSHRRSAVRSRSRW